MDEILENKLIEEGELNEVPRFYRSLSDSPLASIVDNVPIRRGFLKFVRVVDSEVTVPEFDMGLGIAGTATLVVPHKVKDQIPFVNCYYKDIQGSAEPNTGGPVLESKYIDRKNITISFVNEELTPVIAKIRSFIYTVI